MYRLAEPNIGNVVAKTITNARRSRQYHRGLQKRPQVCVDSLLARLCHGTETGI
jgi:hypothetical protein